MTTMTTTGFKKKDGRERENVRQWYPVSTFAPYLTDADVLEHRVVELTLELTKVTSPSPHDINWFRNVLKRQSWWQCVLEDEGNFVVHVGDVPISSNTLFLAHFDTADYGGSKQVTQVYADGVLSSDGTTILGADNKSGVALLMYMIEQGVPGTYMFVNGEEQGRIGSTYMAKRGWGEGYSRAIQFDRYGFDSIITHQMGERACSDDFANALAQQLNSVQEEFNYAPDAGGVYTDTYSFHPHIPECTNISVGYAEQHTAWESQDLKFLALLAEAVLQVDWEGLPTVQNPRKRGVKQRSYGGSVYRSDEAEKWDEDWNEFQHAAEGGHQKWVDLRLAAENDTVNWSDVFTFVQDHPLTAADKLLVYLYEYSERKKWEDEVNHE